MKQQAALIIVDLQNDFCAGGIMARHHDDDIVPLINQLQAVFPLVVASQDWHPENHASFASNHPGHQAGDVISVMGYPQTLWPDHCVQGSHGAMLHPGLHTERIEKIFFKGTDHFVDSYSAFYDNARLRSTGLDVYLREQKIEEVYITGLATDFCVKTSVLDALEAGFSVSVVIDACRGFDANPGDVDRAIEIMRQAGAQIISSVDILK
jgi:nicotinamidase/pyrazinamidase